jgi:hypothetical protein
MWKVEFENAGYLIATNIDIQFEIEHKCQFGCVQPKNCTPTIVYK